MATIKKGNLLRLLGHTLICKRADYTKSKKIRMLRLSCLESCCSSPNDIKFRAPERDVLKLLGLEHDVHLKKSSKSSKTQAALGKLVESLALQVSNLKKMTIAQDMPKRTRLNSYCAIHKTIPIEGEPCWACVNKHHDLAYEEGWREGLKGALRSRP